MALKIPYLELPLNYINLKYLWNDTFTKILKQNQKQINGLGLWKSLFTVRKVYHSFGNLHEFVSKRNLSHVLNEFKSSVL